MLKIFLPLLCLLFIGLKLTGYIAWSWFLVLLPVIWLPIVLVVVGFLYLIVCIIKEFTQ